MDSRDDVTKQQLAHPFTLPKFGEQIVCRNDGVTYTLGEPLDEGGFGQVFCCVDDRGDPLVAKILRPIATVEEMGVRATEEFLASAMVKSPHVGHVHNAFIPGSVLHNLGTVRVYAARHDE